MNPTSEARYALFFEDLVGSGQMLQTAVSGTGAAATPDTADSDGTHSGTGDVATGTTTTGRATVYASLQSVVAGGGGRIVWEAAINIPTLSTAGERYTLYVGMGDETGAGDMTDGVYFRYSDNLSSGNWERATAAAATRTQQDTTIAAATGWTRLRIEVNAQGTSCQFFINDADAGSITTNIPVSPNRFGPLIFKIEKSAGTTSRRAIIDYVLWRKAMAR